MQAVEVNGECMHTRPVEINGECMHTRPVEVNECMHTVNGECMHAYEASRGQW